MDLICDQKQCSRLGDTDMEIKAQDYVAPKHWKDIIQKYISALYKDSVLEF